MRQPFLGHGFGGFWTARHLITHHIGEAHNGYLEVLLGVGIVGLFLTVMFLLSSTGKAARLLVDDYDLGSLAICFVVMTVVHNITESSVDSFGRYLMANVLFVAISIPKFAFRQDDHGENWDRRTVLTSFIPSDANPELLLWCVSISIGTERAHTVLGPFPRVISLAFRPSLG